METNEVGQLAADDLLIVGIGASAGGLEALQRFFKALPPGGDGVTFVVIVHLDPQRESSMAEVLRLHTGLPVSQVTERQKIEPNHVYVIPPNKSLSVSDSHLYLSDFEEPRGRRAPIDLFFRSLSRVQGRGVGIVLSGSGTDGTIGLKTIKELGGLVMAQDPRDAEHDSMPRSAISTGLVDFILSAEELAQKVVAYQKDRRLIRIPHDSEDLPEDDAEALLMILAHMRNRTGHDFSDYKRSTVLRRTGRRMQVNQLASLVDYLRYLQTNPEEEQALLKNLLVSVTHFFRDLEAWNALDEQVLSMLVPEKTMKGDLRVWVPGCATGEEAYTIAMLLLERADALSSGAAIQIFASDLDEEALAYGRQGLYPATIAADISEERLERFFTKAGNYYAIAKEVRERVLFASHSLLKDPPFSKLDLISCRNVLIYLNRSLQENVFRLFHYALRPGGYLFLGNAESADNEMYLFQDVDKKHRIYRRSETGEMPRLPTLQLSRRSYPDHVHMVDAHVDHTAPSGVDRHRKMLEQYAPPSLIVSRSFEILHLSEAAGRYLKRPGGQPSDNIIHEVRPELQLDLQAALHHAFEHGRPTSTWPVEVSFNGDTRWVHIIVQPGGEEYGTRDQALVLFAEVEAVGISGTEGEEPRFRLDVETLRRQSEGEVRRLRERLQATVQDFEASKEEMKASNEELQSLNEEYKSTAEELETSKEELQSVNEELATVNEELKSKVEELSQTNSDLRNLMAATDIGTLFLDRELRIQRYTPRIRELFHVMPGDVGRPITHLTHTIEYDAFVEDAERVLQGLVPIEREVRVQNGTWFLMRLRPYHTIADRIEGVVITFVDITRRLREEDARREAEEDLRKLSEQFEQRIQERTELIRGLMKALVLAEEKERQRIAEILHDDIQQHLYALRMTLDLLRKPGTEEEAQRLHEQAADTLDQATQLARTLSMELGTVLGSKNMLELAESVATRKKERYDLDVDVQVQGDVPLPENSLSILLHQVLRELLFNVVKHGGVNRARLSAREEAGTVVVQVEDEGKGFDVAVLETVKPNKQMGLVRVRDRIEVVGGRFHIDSEPGKGTRVTLTLPLENHDSSLESLEQELER